MLVRINGLPLVDEQEELFQDVKESFARHIDDYKKKHWFKEFVYYWYCYLTEESKAEKAYRAWLKETGQIDGIEIDLEKMAEYIEKFTGIHRIIVATVLDAEEMYLRKKGVIWIEQNQA